MKNVKVIAHPLLQHKLTLLRDKNTQPWEFRSVMSELASLMAYEVTREIKVGEVEIETPLEKTSGLKVRSDLVLVSIMRAGNGMLEGLLRMLPFAAVGHIGIYRDKFINNTVEYYFRLPKDVKGKEILIADPLCATADTAVAALERLKQYGVGKIRFMCIVGSPQGLKRLSEAHPDIEIFTLSIDRELNEKGYILPGLGDAGDRLYGTNPSH